MIGDANFVSWKSVCGVDDLAAGSLKEFEIDGVPILIANLGDIFRAFPPVCPHMEEPLEFSGICEGDLLTCSKHLWQWNMRTGQFIDPAEKPLLQYETRVADDTLYAYIEEELEYEFDDDDDF